MHRPVGRRLSGGVIDKIMTNGTSWRGLKTSAGSLSSSEELGYTVDESIAVPRRKLERSFSLCPKKLAVWKKNPRQKRSCAATRWRFIDAARVSSFNTSAECGDHLNCRWLIYTGRLVRDEIRCSNRACLMPNKNLTKRAIGTSSFCVKIRYRCYVIPKQFGAFHFIALNHFKFINDFC